MTALRLFTSNRLEILTEALARVVGTPLSSPLDEEVIIVMSAGMKRWVSMQLAQYLGICANFAFPFPNTFVREISQKVVPNVSERLSFDPRIMTWKIMKLLPDFITKPGFESLKVYLGDTAVHLKRFQLSERIADTFDQYLLFRPEMIFRWESGEEEHWQAVLWRELVRGNEGGHRAALGKAFLEAVRDSSTNTKGLPERICAFGISALPRFHMEVLAALSRFTQVNLFFMNPSREYWGDIVTDWAIQRATSGLDIQDVTIEELYLEKGNSLLASMGALGKDFFEMVNDFDCEEFSSFEDPAEDNLLCCLQSDILNLRDRPQSLKEKKVFSAYDSSIQIHSCHSPMREIEALHDQILDMFEEDPSLMPKDILVMTPDIESYAPYIHAVFDTPSDEAKRIPITIADRSIRRESEVIDTFLAILELCGTRFGASQVVSILESPAVQRKFELAETDLDLIRRWVTQTRIRWGIDGESRGQMDLPSFPQNTWKAGLDRLLLGYAIPGQDQNMFGDVLPYDHIEGSEETLALGNFLEFATELFSRARSFMMPRTLYEWSKTLTRLLDSFFLPDEDTEREMQALRCTLNVLADSQEVSAFEEEIDVTVIQYHLGHSLDREGFGYGFFAGGVTFCAMLPMRSIPFKVICLVGMNSDAYPRQSKPLGFDLIAKHPKPGDRSRRNDDRYLFLEAVLSARERLYISYIGQSIQDNSLIPPSVLVSELMDYIEQGFEIPGNETLGRIVTKHRLQAFSPEYFKENEKLFSYSEENCQAAQWLLEDREPAVPFITQAISVPGEEWKTVDLDDLVRFFGNPTRFLLNRRLGIHLEERASILEEREAFEIKGMERYLLEENLVKSKFSGLILEDLFPSIQASGQLPHGTVGRCIYESVTQGVEGFGEKSKPYMEGKPLLPLEVDLGISGFRLTGRLDALSPERLLRYRYARVKATDRLKVWIHHLALNSVKADNYPRTSVLVGLNPNNRKKPVWAAWEYSAVQNSEEILGMLLEGYWAGLVKPLHFFPESSWVYVHMLLERNKPPEKALRSARDNWTGSDFNRGESEDAHYELCFRSTDPLDSEFQRIAEEVFTPFLAHQRKI
ncbi:exodeoxyribonuclease V subunit gamma [Thermodesulfobacteriota bacterium]